VWLFTAVVARWQHCWRVGGLCCAVEGRRWKYFDVLSCDVVIQSLLLGGSTADVLVKVEGEVFWCFVVWCCSQFHPDKLRRHTVSVDNLDEIESISEPEEVDSEDEEQDEDVYEGQGADEEREEEEEASRGNDCTVMI